MLRGIAETTGTPLKKLIEIAGEFTKFFKHANRDPAAKLENFTLQDAEMILYWVSRISTGSPTDCR